MNDEITISFDGNEFVFGRDEDANTGSPIYIADDPTHPPAGVITFRQGNNGWETQNDLPDGFRDQVVKAIEENESQA